MHLSEMITAELKSWITFLESTKMSENFRDFYEDSGMSENSMSIL